MQNSRSEAWDPDAMHITRQDRPESLVSDVEVRNEGSHTSSPEDATNSQGEGGSGSRGEAPGFRLTLSAMRGALNNDSDDDECTSHSSADSSTGTPPESSAQFLGAVTDEGLQTSHLEVDRNSVNISTRSSLDVQLSFASGPEPDEAGAAEGGPPDGSPMNPWLRFLYDEIESTESSGEEYTHLMLLVLWEYFVCRDATEEHARCVADALLWVNDEFLLCLSSWEFFEQDQDLQGFLWLVWGALLEVVVRMDYRDDSQDSVVLLVRELLRPRPTRYIRILGRAGQTWQASEIPDFGSIWPSAYVGFGPKIGSRHPIEASPEEWIACSSFLGRLTGAGLTECWGLGVWALEDALSKQYWQGRIPSRGLECVVLAGAEYIKHAGERLAMTGVQSFSPDRWISWMDRFGEVADLFDDGPGPVQWAAWSAREHMFTLGKEKGLM